jgi:hypothetical protein
MAFAVNHAQASQGKYLPPEGTYEVIIDKAEEKTTAMSGKRLINFAFEIRSDVMQDEQGQAFEYGMFPLNKPTVNDPEGYRLGTIQMICKCIGIPEGMNFGSLAEWLDAITHMPIKVEVKHREYNGQDQINVNYLPTEFPVVSAGTVVDPDELPF